MYVCIDERIDVKKKKIERGRVCPPAIFRLRSPRTRETREIIIKPLSNAVQIINRYYFSRPICT